MTNEKLVRQIRAVGESLIKNAESIAGTETYLTGINISVYLEAGIDAELPEINATKWFVPEKIVEENFS